MLSQSLGTLAGGHHTRSFLAAKMLGRWADGSSLDLYPDKPGATPATNSTMPTIQRAHTAPGRTYAPRQRTGFIGLWRRYPAAPATDPSGDCVW